jgi:hypothetical protein
MTPSSVISLPEGCINVQAFLSSRSLRAVITCAIVLTFSQLVIAKGSFTVKPAPNWVKRVVPTVDPVGTKSSTGSSSTKILDDEQIRVNGSSVERYSHYYQRVDTTAGLDDLSQLRFDFEPSYQQLAIHFIRILRGGSIINALKPSEIKTIQEEEELDQQLYNGTLSAVVFVNDLRVGDVVEYAYTITGENPVLGGRFTDTLYLAGVEPIDEVVLRLVYPTKRQLAIKSDKIAIEPSKQTIGEDTEYLWYARNVDPVPYNDSTPDWFNPYPRIILSEFQTWADVVNWALPMYQNSSLKNPELQARIEDWKKQFAAPGDRAIAALRFVQDEIRYLGIELGPYSHQPTAPEKVFTRRFGDCKDKSLLLSSILNLMGIEASTALVNTRVRSSLDEWQPTPYAFDHVIVRSTINGKTYWLDPTISYQRGNLDSYHDPSFERALVLNSGSSSLEKIKLPASGAASLDVIEVYSGANSQSPVTLSVTKTYRGTAADDIRYSLSTAALEDISRSLVNSYMDVTPVIEADGLPVIEDDQAKNVLVVKEKYFINQLWRDNKHRFFADKIYAELGKPTVVLNRSTPLEIRYPVAITQTILINLGSGFDFPNDRDVFTNEALRFEYNYSRNGNQLSMSFSLKTFQESLPVEAFQSHLDLLDKAQRVVGYELNRGQATLGARDRGTSVLEPGESSIVLKALVWAVILVPIGLFLLWLVRGRGRRQRQTQFVKELQVRPGASPETALPMATVEQMESVLTNFNCRCGQRPYNPDAPAKRERFTYDGQRLIGIRLLCDACRQSSDLYLNPLFENDGAGVADLSPS